MTSQLLVYVLLIVTTLSILSEAQNLNFPGRTNFNNNPGSIKNNKTPSPTAPIPPPAPAPHPIYDFARNLFLKATDLPGARNENVLISPFSIRAVSALVFLGSKGENIFMTLTQNYVKNCKYYEHFHNMLCIVYNSFD